MRSEIPVVPEVKYYDEEVSSLDSKFSDLKEFVSSIPNYDVDDQLNHIQDKFNEDIQKLSEDIEVKDFESRVDVDTLKTSLKETTENIYEELKKSSDKINFIKVFILLILIIQMEGNLLKTHTVIQNKTTLLKDTQVNGTT